MLRSLLLAATAALLFTPYVAAQTVPVTPICAYEAQEIIVDVVGNAQLQVEVFTSDGVRRDNATVNASTRNGCGLLIETNDAGSVPSYARDWRFGDPDIDTGLRLLTVQFTDAGFKPAKV